MDSYNILRKERLVPIGAGEDKSKVLLGTLFLEKGFNDIIFISL